MVSNPKKYSYIYIIIYLLGSAFLSAQIQPCNNPTLPNPGSGFGISRVYIEGRLPATPAIYSNTTPIEEGFTKEYDSSGVGIISLNICKEYYLKLNMQGVASVWTWIDLDQDGVFNDSNEVITPGASGFFSSTDAITFMPEFSGKTLYMRVAAKLGLGQLMHPCDTALAKGDVEDYKINILPADSFPVPHDTTGICRYKNLVLNYSFEELCCCPTSWGLYEEITKNAYSANNASTDIFNKCSYGNNTTVPFNAVGYQQPRSGNGYAGIIVYESTTNWHEYIQLELSAPLTGGKKYYYEFYLNHSNRSKFSIDEFGLYFFNDTVYEPHSRELSVTPQITISNPLFFNDTLNWVKISGYYTPLLSGDKYIVFGNFKDSSTTNINNNGFGVDNWAYYYVDDFFLIPEPEFSIPTYTASICFGDSILLTAPGTCFVNWVDLRDTSDTLSYTSGLWVKGDTLATLKIVVSGNDGGSIWVKDTFSITVIPYPVANAGTDDTICFGQQVNLSATGGGNYLWNTGATTQNITQQPGTNSVYTVTVDNGACIDIDSILIEVNPVPDIGINTTHILCNGQNTGSANAVVNGTLSYTYSWNTGNTNAQITGLATGTYTVTVTDPNGCNSDSTITITEPAALQVNSTPLVYICNGQNATLSTSISGGTGSYTYNWSPGGATTNSLVVTATSTTQYTITATDSNGCTTPFTITVSPGPALTVSVSTAISICEGDNVQLSSTILSGVGNYSYSWNPGGLTTNNINVSPTITTKYYLTVSDSCNNYNDSVLITVNNLPAILASLDDSICEGNEIVMNASGAISYTWSPTVTIITTSGDTVKASPNINTTYTVTGTDANNCTDSEVINIVVNQTPAVDAGANVTILQGNSTTLTASGGTGYNWSPATGLSCNTCAMPIASPDISTMYYVSVTDSNGCVNIDSVYIEVDVLCGDFFIPNVFSPNGDGQNDVLKLFLNGAGSVHFIVYNRWGEIVFETNNPQDGWDGRYKNKIMDTAVFNYIAQHSCNGQEITKKGTISLIR